jgi:23S rRNA (uracil1939-C5)-methyltransferase
LTPSIPCRSLSVTANGQEEHDAQGRTQLEGKEEAEPLDQGEAGQEEGEARGEAGDGLIPALSAGDLVEARIEKLVYGGLGLAHVAGQVLLVPYAAPGDRLAVRITEVGRRVLRGSIEAIVERSTARVEPDCAHFGACGGCQLQHVDRSTELAAKAEFVRDCLRRIGGVHWGAPIEVVAGEPYGWRSRAELHVFRTKAGERRAGYFRAASRDLVAIDDCPVLEPALREELRGLAKDPARIPRDAEHLDLAAGDDGAVARAPGARVHRSIGGFAFVFEAGSFAQGNVAIAEELVRRAIGTAHGDVAFDLYAGPGLFTLPLARRFSVVHAVEAEPRSVSLGTGNALANGIDNVRWSEERVEDWLDARAGELHPEFVLLDPPRAGAGKRVVDAVAACAPREIAYVSCDPATLARDVRHFLDRGRAIRAITALDMFPRSYHVETLVHFT